jgi:hypothetical protein
LKAKLAASTATFKIMMCPKVFYPRTGGGNGDSMDRWLDERDELAHYIDDAVNNSNPDNWAVPGGVIWCCGDRHWPYVVNYDVDNGDSLDVICIDACPSGTEFLSPAIPVTASNNVIFFRWLARRFARPGCVWSAEHPRG